MSGIVKSVLDGTNVILSMNGAAFGFSTGCKVTTSAETGERVTKEASAGKWKEKYVKTISETISVDGLVLVDGDTETPTYDQLKQAMEAGMPITLNYNLREGSTRTGKTAGGYQGKYICTSLDLDAQAGDDAKYSAQFENSGAVAAVTGGNGLSDAANKNGVNVSATAASDGGKSVKS